MRLILCSFSILMFLNSGAYANSIEKKFLEELNELKKERDRYKDILDDIKTFGSLRPKTIEDIRDLK